MTMMALSFLLLQVPAHGIFGGFTPQWVRPNASIGKVALTVGSAEIDGQVVTTSAASGNDSPAISPALPPGAAVVQNQTWVAYCYVLDLSTVAPNNSWFQAVAGHNFDFWCQAGAAYAPLPDGHPTTALPYVPPPPGMGGPFNISAAIFVGSVVATELASTKLANGNGPGLSVIPFFRNGSEAIYSTNQACVGCNATWDLGLPTHDINGGRFALQNPPTGHPDTKAFDFTADLANNSLPLSSSAVILETDAVVHQDMVGTLCFLDPNVPVIVGTSQRSCQSEVQVEAGHAGPPFTPMTPFRTRMNLAAGANGPNGMIVLGAACSVGQSTQLYFDVAYRGYIEPERQLVPQVH